MYQFYFNSETLPECETCDNFLPLFSKSLLAFDELLKEKHLKIQKGIVTEKMPVEIMLGKLTFQEALDNITNTALKTLAYSYFTKYPIERHLKIENEEVFLEKAYRTIVDNIEYEVLYLSYVATQKQFAFTVALHSDLEKNELCLLPKDDSETLLLKNLYGNETNTVYIRQYIEELKLIHLSYIEQLIYILTFESHKPICSSKFEKDFEKLNNLQQHTVLEGFKEAVKEQIKETIQGDGFLVKKVTVNQKNKKHDVHELRIGNPFALRVYFTKYEGKIFLASIGKKSSDTQNSDIRKAHKILVNEIRQH